MMLRQKRKERLPELKHPGDPEAEWCSPGSIEQGLDMCETGSLRGDDILHSHGRESPGTTGDPLELDSLINEYWENWEMNLAEDNQEDSEKHTENRDNENSLGLESEVE